MLVKLGWYEARIDQSINGYIIKKGYEVYVPEITINENIDLCYITVSIGEGIQMKLPIETFKKRFFITESPYKKRRKNKKKNK